MTLATKKVQMFLDRLANYAVQSRHLQREESSSHSSIAFCEEA